MLTHSEISKVETSDVEVLEETSDQQKNTVSFDCSTKTEDLGSSVSANCEPSLNSPLYHVINCSTEGENLPIRNQPVVSEAPSAFQNCDTDEEKQHGFLTGWSVCNFTAFIWMALYAFQCFILNAWRYLFKKRSKVNHCFCFGTKKKYRLGDAVNLEKVFSGSSKKSEAHKKFFRAPTPIDNLFYLEDFVPSSDIKNKNIAAFKRISHHESRLCRRHSAPFLNNSSMKPNRPNTGNRGATTLSNFEPSLTENHALHKCSSLSNLNNIGAKSFQSTVTIANNNGDGPANQANKIFASGPGQGTTGSNQDVEQQETAVDQTDCHGNGKIPTKTFGILEATGNSQEVWLQQSIDDLVLGSGINCSGINGRCKNKSGTAVTMLNAEENTTAATECLTNHTIDQGDNFDTSSEDSYLGNPSLGQGQENVHLATEFKSNTGTVVSLNDSMPVSKNGFSGAPQSDKNGSIRHRGGNGNQPKETKNQPANNKYQAPCSSGLESNQAYGGGGDVAAAGGTGNGDGDDGDRGHDKKKKPDNLNDVEDEKQEKDENEDDDDAKTEKSQPEDQAMPDISHTAPDPLPAETDCDGAEKHSLCMNLDNPFTTRDENLEENDIKPEKMQQEVPTGQVPTEKDDEGADYHHQYMHLDNSKRKVDNIISTIKVGNDMNTEKAQLHRDHGHHFEKMEHRAGFEPATTDHASTALPTELSSVQVTDTHSTTLEDCISIGSTWKNPEVEHVTMDHVSTALPSVLSSAPATDAHSTTLDGRDSVGSTWEKTQLVDPTDQSPTNKKDDDDADHQSQHMKPNNPEKLGEDVENNAKTGVENSTPADQASPDDNEDTNLCENKQKSENSTRLEMEEPDGEPVPQLVLNMTASDKMSAIAKIDGSNGAKVDYKNQEIDNLGNLEDENGTSSNISLTGVDYNQCGDNQSGDINPNMAGKQEKDGDYNQNLVTQTPLLAPNDQTIPAISKSSAKKNVTGEQGDEKNLKIALLADKGQKQEVANGNDSVEAGSNKRKRHIGKSAAKKNVSGDQGDGKNLKIALLADKGQKQGVANEDDSVEAGSNKQKSQVSHDSTSDGVGRTVARSSIVSINDASDNSTFLRETHVEVTDIAESRGEPIMFQLQNLKENVRELNQESLKIQEGAINHGDVNGKGTLATTQNPSGTSKNPVQVEDIDSKKAGKAPFTPVFEDMARDRSLQADRSDIKATDNGRSAAAKTLLNRDKVGKSVVKTKQKSQVHNSLQPPSNDTKVKDGKTVLSKTLPSIMKNSAVNSDDLEKRKLQKPREEKPKASASSFGLSQVSDYEGRQGQQSANMLPLPNGRPTEPRTENANVNIATAVCQEKALVDALGVEKVSMKSFDSNNSSQSKELHTATEQHFIEKNRPQSPHRASGDEKSESDRLLQQRGKKCHKQNTPSGYIGNNIGTKTTLPDKSSSQNGKLGVPFPKVLKKALGISGAKEFKHSEKDGESSQSPQNSNSTRKTLGNREIRSSNVSPGNGSRVGMNQNLPSLETKQPHGSNLNKLVATDIPTTSGLASQKTEKLGTLEMAAEMNLPPKTSRKKAVRKKLKNILKVNGHDKTSEKAARMVSKKKTSAPPFEFPQNAATEPSNRKGKFHSPAAKRDNVQSPLESISAYKSAATAAAQTEKILPSRRPKKKRPKTLTIWNDTHSSEKMRESFEIKSPLSDREEFTFDVNNNTQTSFEILLPNASSENLPEFKMAVSPPLALTVEQPSAPSLPRPTTLQLLPSNMPNAFPNSKQDVQMPDALNHIQKGLLNPTFQMTGLSSQLSPNHIDWDPTEGPSGEDIQYVPSIEEEKSNKALGNPGASVESIDDPMDASPKQLLQLEDTNLGDSGLHNETKPIDSSGFVLDGDRITDGENMKEKKSLPEILPGCNPEEGGIVATAETTLASVSVCNSQQHHELQRQAADNRASETTVLKPRRKLPDQHSQKRPKPSKRKPCQPAQIQTIKPLPWPSPAKCKSPEASLRPQTEPTLQKQNEPPGKELHSKQIGSLIEAVDNSPNPPVQTAPKKATGPPVSFDVTEVDSELGVASIREEKIEDCSQKKVLPSDEETPPIRSTTAEDDSQLEDIPDSPGEEDLLMPVVNTEATLAQGAEDFVAEDHSEEDDAESSPVDENDTHLLPLVIDENKPLSAEETDYTVAELLPEPGALGGFDAAENIPTQTSQLPCQSETNDTSELGATGGVPVQPETGAQRQTQPQLPVLPLKQEEIRHTAFSVAEQVLTNVAVRGPPEHPGREDMQQLHNPLMLPLVAESEQAGCLSTEPINPLQETDINLLQDQTLGPNRQLQNQPIPIHGGDAVVTAANEAISQPLEIGNVSGQEGVMMIPIRQHQDEVLPQNLESLADPNVVDNLDVVDGEAAETEDEIHLPVPEPEFPPEAKGDGNPDELEDPDDVHFPIQEQVGPPQPVAPLPGSLRDMNPIMAGATPDGAMAVKDKMVSSVLVCKRRCYVCHGWEAFGYFGNNTYRFYCTGCYTRETVDDHKKAFSSQSNYFKPRKRVCAVCYHPVITRSPIVCDRCGNYFCQIQCYRVHECQERTVWTWDE